MQSEIEFDNWSFAIQVHCGLISSDNTKHCTGWKARPFFNERPPIILEGKEPSTTSYFLVPKALGSLLRVTCR
jgi:hypothetical protein